MTGAHRWGVQTEYRDARGQLVNASPETVAAAVRALGRGARAPAADGPLFLHPGDALPAPLEVVTEDGRNFPLAGSVGPDVPLGYHRAATRDGERRVVVSPGRCHLPAQLRLGGWAVQLYAARSSRSWGIGDLGDLATFGAWAAKAGTGFAMVSPLAAALPVTPIEASPYLPTSRRWRNPLHVRVEDVPGSAVLGAELDGLAAAGRALNQRRRIDRDAILALKLVALRRIHAAAAPSSAFRAWRRRQGDSLERFATFCALADVHGADTGTWPAALRDCESDAVRAFRAGARREVRFHAWMQWLIVRQLRAAAARLPLIADLPIGVAPGGADVWADPELFATGFSVGAPPDLFNVTGQDWAQPPWNPWALRERGYAPLTDVLRGGFEHAMGLRIDHVMGLFRLYWIPRGQPPSAGVFVGQPAAEILDVLALESARARGVVVGEDLGTVEPSVRAELGARDVLSYRLLWFEDGPPNTLPERALAAVSTHDLPTIAGLWTGSDVAALEAIGVAVNREGTAEVRSRLERVAGGADSVAAVTEAAYAALAESPAMLVAASLDDAAMVEERPNMPGTTGDRWPNWSLALPAPLEELLAAPLVRRIASVLGARTLSRRGGGGRARTASGGRRRGAAR